MRRLVVVCGVAGFVSVVGAFAVLTEPAGAAGPQEPPAPAGSAAAGGGTCSVRGRCGMPPVISAGWGHSCGLTSSGGVRCWGNNEFGQLGDGTTEDRTVPTQVVGLTSGVKAVWAFMTHTCALTSQGAVLCWGENVDGRIGDGTTTNRNTPAQVPGLTSGVVTIAGGRYHTCAVTSAGAVRCWGGNEYAQLGDGTYTARAVPTQVSGLTSGVTAISAGNAYTCAITSAGGVRCWGSNEDGQLGDGTTTRRSVPTQVSGLTSGVVEVATGQHTCALTSAGAVRCWGRNGNGQLGNGTTTNSTEPTQVSGLTSGVIALSLGQEHSCALTSARGVHCWGKNENGELGDGTTADRSVPTQVSGLTSGTIAVSAGCFHTCARTSQGDKCWGYNRFSQLGDGTTTNRNFPTAVTGGEEGGSRCIVPGSCAMPPVMSAGMGHTCAISPTGVKCWGFNDYGTLGDGTNTNRNVPTAVSQLAGGITAVSAGDAHTCALTSKGGVLCWGENDAGQLGDGTKTDRAVPTQVSGLPSGVASVTAGAGHSCALLSPGRVRCWGSNNRGQLGDGTTTNRSVPTQVRGLTSGVVAVSTANEHTCALTSAGKVLCWGRNDEGMLGDGTIIDRYVPTPIVGLTSGVVAVAAGYFHTCAITSAGGAWCWGTNTRGQLGDGTTESRTTPTPVSGLASGVVGVAASFHTCVLTTAGGSRCWGYNNGGQLGDGTKTNRTVPTPVSGLASGVVAVSVGREHTCALTSAGGVRCWGHNHLGQLGDGSFNDRPVPSIVSGFR